MNSLSPIEIVWPPPAGAVVPDSLESELEPELEPQAARASIARTASPEIDAVRIRTTVRGFDPIGLDFIVRVFTIGHGTRDAAELVETLVHAGVRTLVDVRRFPGSRRNPQFNRHALAASLAGARIEYRHAVELGGRREGEPDEERFDCVRTATFRSYAARMARGEWQEALAAALVETEPCFMCAETDWRRCHRRLISDLLTAREIEVVHLVGPGERERHELSSQAEIRSGRLYLCAELVA